MKFPLLRRSLFILFMIYTLMQAGCEQFSPASNKSNALGNRPELDCIISNDFYAVHFSTYIQPSKDQQNSDPKAAFIPYCQKIPRAGKMFFTADLIDRDIRATPIGIRLVEVEKTSSNDKEQFKEIRTVTEIPAKLYPRGAVEAQAEIDKNGDYLLYFLIGDAVEDDDKFKVSLEVGVDPNSLPIPLIAIAGIAAILLFVLVFLVYLYKFKPKKSA